MHEPGNYRPTILTSVICKTMDKLVREIIVMHMSANKLFSNKQFGFISGRPTTLQLLKVMDEWTDILLLSHLFYTYASYAEVFYVVLCQKLS
jgi:hypothetical protein